MENKYLKDYSDIDFESLKRKELGPRSFEIIHDKIMDIKGLFDQMVEIGNHNVYIPDGLKKAVEERVRDFITRFVKPIMDYNYQQDESRQFHNHNNIVRMVNELHVQIFSQQNNNNTLSLYSAMKSFDLSAISDTLKRADTAEKKFTSLAGQQEEVLNSLRGQAGGKTIQDYAAIFHNQSQNHSGFSLNIKPKFKIKVGAAYYWIATGIALLVFCLIRLYKLDEWFPIVENNPYANTAALIKRLVVISAGIFAIGFCFRQFSINKHLYTLNKHRANALNSYLLFIESIGKDDPSARSQLMLHVAKAIYEQSSTGYLHQKSAEQKDPSILELTRMITSKQ